MVLSFDLQDFIIRARVLKLYRQALRTARRAPEQARGEFYIFDRIIHLSKNYLNDGYDQATNSAS